MPKGLAPGPGLCELLYIIGILKGQRFRNLFFSPRILYMKRPVRQEDGLYHIKGQTYKAVRGSRQQVWNKTAFKTPGGLVRKELTMSHGRIVSLKKHKTAKKERRLEKYGYFAEKGKFGYVKKNVKSRKVRKGGAAPLSPESLAVSA